MGGRRPGTDSPGSLHLLHCFASSEQNGMKHDFKKLHTGCSEGDKWGEERAQAWPELRVGVMVLREPEPPGSVGLVAAALVSGSVASEGCGKRLGYHGLSDQDSCSEGHRAGIRAESSDVTGRGLRVRQGRTPRTTRGSYTHTPPVPCSSAPPPSTPQKCLSQATTEPLRLGTGGASVCCGTSRLWFPSKTPVEFGTRARNGASCHGSQQTANRQRLCHPPYFPSCLGRWLGCQGKQGTTLAAAPSGHSVGTRHRRQVGVGCSTFLGIL